MTVKVCWYVNSEARCVWGSLFDWIEELGQDKFFNLVCQALE